MSEMSIDEMIQTCDPRPSEDTIRRLLTICAAISDRIDDLEADATRERLRARRAANKSTAGGKETSARIEELEAACRTALWIRDRLQERGSFGHSFEEWDDIENALQPNANKK